MQTVVKSYQRFTFSCVSCVSVQGLSWLTLTTKHSQLVLNVFIFGFYHYVTLILLGELFFIKEKGDRKTTLSVLTTPGSTTSLWDSNH